jgi:flagellar hook protein FlgE
MPNHIQNRLIIIGTAQDVDELLYRIKGTTETGKEIEIDFDKIIPMPDDLQIESDSYVTILEPTRFRPIPPKWVIDKELNNLINTKGETDPVTLNFKKAMENVEKYGHATWYTWRVGKWGTKWNAYKYNDSRNTNSTIYFQTAWSAPLPVIEKLSEMFPNVTLTLDYADEDSGSNTGKVVFKGGEKIIEYYPESQSKEAYDLFFELYPDDRSLFKLVDGKYEHVDE